MTRAAAPLHLTEVREMTDLRAVSDLFVDVWGPSSEGSPMPSEVLRALVHAGGLVNVATADASDGAPLLGAAVLAPTADGGGYSMIAAAQPGHGDRGIGTALKEHQRAWARRHGMATITWTFDPLVARNGRFNLDKLGAVAEHYERTFYGVMTDSINGGDDSDRLVAVWHTHAPTPSDTASPDPAHTVSLRTGPDGRPAYLIGRSEHQRWVRVPTDIVALRRADPQQGRRWRLVVREAMEDAFAHGLVATGVSRDHWYQFTSTTARSTTP